MEALTLRPVSTLMPGRMPCPFSTSTNCTPAAGHSRERQGDKEVRQRLDNPHAEGE
jgi:hypothetical protein